jgi:hypothetical protein
LNCSRKVGQPTVNVEILILPDGKIWCQTDGNLPGTFAYPAYWVSNFYTSPSRPLTPNLGSQYYIKFVLTSGQAWLGGLNSGQVYSMSVARSVYWGFSSTASATGTVYIYSDAGGTALVDSATFTVNGS